MTELEKKVMRSANLDHVSKTWFSGPYKFESKGCEVEVTAHGQGVILEWSVEPIYCGITGIEVKIFDDDECSTVWLERDGEEECCSDFDHTNLTDAEKRRLEAWEEIMYRDDFCEVTIKLAKWFGVDCLLCDNMVSSGSEWHTNQVCFFSDKCKAEYSVAAFGKFDEDKPVLDEIEVMVLTPHANAAVLVDADGNMKPGDKPEKNVIRVLANGAGCETYPADDEDMGELNVATDELSHGNDFDVSVMRNFITFICSVYGTYGKD